MGHADEGSSNCNRKRLNSWLGKIGIGMKISEIQRTIILHSARILRKEEFEECC